jgi:hypothetical protein
MLIHGRRASQDKEYVFAHYKVFSLPFLLGYCSFSHGKIAKKLLRQRIFVKGIGQVGPSVKISKIVDNLPVQKN